MKEYCNPFGIKAPQFEGGNMVNRAKETNNPRCLRFLLFRLALLLNLMRLRK